MYRPVRSFLAFIVPVCINGLSALQIRQCHLTSRCNLIPINCPLTAVDFIFKLDYYFTDWIIQTGASLRYRGVLCT